RQFKHAQGEIGWNPLLLLWPLLNLLVARKIMARLGGRIRLAICGGAPLPAGVARFFVSLGLPLLQGYGLTEASPVVSVNRIERNRPESIGLPLPEVEVRIAADGELQTRSPCVMRGYWQDEAATHATFTADGWLRTGDKARMDEAGFIYITGRLKEIIVLSNGEKVPPADMEMAIMLDPLFEQVMVVGESKPYLAALAVMSRDVWREMAREYNVNPDDPAVLRRPEIRERVLQRMSLRLKEFPGYAQIRTLHLDLQPWTVEEGLLTPTLKLKRGSLLKKYAAEIESMYRTNKKI
ncbi:MAG TPA: AMP-binding protein, partial [Gammaproteobacteria bacterium]